MSQQLDEETLKIIDRVQKLLNLAAKNSNQAEAEAAAAKAQELLTQYNLDAAMVERTQGVKDGKREELKLRGGFYKWQTELWEAVAELNFCLYWLQTYTVPQPERLVAKGRSPFRYQKRHRLIGRIVNTTATKVMATYLEQCVERAVRETLKVSAKEQFGNYAASFRKGCADELIRKVGERYRERLKAERLKAAKMEADKERAAAAGFSTSTAITLSDYIQTEHDANMDHLHGEGWSAKRRAQEAAWAKQQAEEEAAYTAWAAAHPEEARAKEEAERASREKEAKRSRYRGGRTPRDKTDYGAYSRGREEGKKISIDPQVGGGEQRRLT